MPDFIETEEERKQRIAEAEAEMRKAEDEVLLKANPEKYWAAKDKAARESKWERDFGGPDAMQKDQVRSDYLEAKNSISSLTPFNPVVPPNWPRAISQPSNQAQSSQQPDRMAEFGNAQSTFNRMTKQDGIHPLDALVKSGLYQFRAQRPPTQFEQAQMQRWNAPPVARPMSEGERLRIEQENQRIQIAKEAAAARANKPVAVPTETVTTRIPATDYKPAVTEVPPSTNFWGKVTPGIPGTPEVQQRPAETRTRKVPIEPPVTPPVAAPVAPAKPDNSQIRSEALAAIAKAQKKSTADAIRARYKQMTGEDL